MAPRNSLLLVAVGASAVAAWAYFSATGEIPADLSKKNVDVPVISTPAAPLVFAGAELARQQILAHLASTPFQPFPACLSWSASYDIGTNGLYSLDFILAHQPLVFLDMALERYRREVKGYNLTFVKQECSDGKPGKLNEPEKIQIHFREQPFSVYMHWLQGARLAKKALYVAGENNNKLLGISNNPILGLIGVVEKDIDGPDAKNSGRYRIDEFGMYKGSTRTAASMRRAVGRGALHVKYLGVFQVTEAGDRLCHKFVRAPYDPPEAEGISEATFYFDQETWLQVGTILKDAEGKLIGEYFFRDIELNPEFDAKQFTRAAL